MDDMSADTSSQNKGVRLEVSGLSKDYGSRKVLQKADLLIEPGEFVAIVGRSGCGKSTLLRLVAGLESASAGVVRVDSQVVSGLNAIMGTSLRYLLWVRCRTRRRIPGLEEWLRHRLV